MVPTCTKVAVCACALVLMSSTQILAVDFYLPGSKLIIKSKNGKEKFVWISKAPGVYAGCFNTSAGLTVSASDGDATAISLENWEENASGCKYKNSQAPDGDSVCKLAAVKNFKMIKVVCKDAVIDVFDPGPEGVIAVKLSIEGKNYCATFSTADIDEPGSYKAKDAPAPGSCAATVPAKRVFVGSVPVNGNLGGLAGADSYCAQRATAGGLSGTYKAWLSVFAAYNNPASRFTHYGGPYALVNGTVIAENWGDLTDGSLAAPINVDEFGATGVNDDVWTGTTAEGGHCAPCTDCISWTSSSNSETGAPGESSGTFSTWTDLNTSMVCGALGRVYCFEQ